MALLLEREALETLSNLLEYPRSDVGERLEAARASLAGACPEAASALSRAREEASSWGRGQWEEAHLRTFDLAANCVPYVGVHLYGEETFKRGALMARLKMAFDRLGFQVEGELPDHVGVLLRFAGQLDPDDRALLAQRLSGTTQAMRTSLAQTDNPYRWVVDAVAQVVDGLAADLPPLAEEDASEGRFEGADSCAGCSVIGHHEEA